LYQSESAPSPIATGSEQHFVGAVALQIERRSRTIRRQRVEQLEHARGPLANAEQRADVSAEIPAAKAHAGANVHER
jgi:hypothetical protein